MKIVLAVQRKIGQPNFGSEGASCEITLDVPETSARDSAMIVAEIRAAYDLAERAVGEQLARHGGPPVQLGTGAPAAVEAAPAAELEPAVAQATAPAPWAEAPDPAAARPAPRLNGNGNGNGGSGYRGNGQPPRSGKALFAWCKDREAEHDYALLRYLNGWAKLQDFPGRMVEWNNDQVALAYSEATRKLHSLTRTDAATPQESAV